MNHHDTTTLRAAAVPEGGPATSALRLRANILAMTQTAEDAVLRPRDPGAWSHGLRAALAARIARANADTTLAAHFAAMADAEHAPLTDPAQPAPGRIAAAVAFADAVAMHPRDVAADDIAGLQAAGVSDADIVRLTELVAFLGYQIRLVAGLRLLTGAAAG